jgi:hypothetical protein
MADYKLTIVDTTGIQAYIFGTNTLRHHMGASWLVDWATQGAVYETVHGLQPKLVSNIDAQGAIDPNRKMEDETLGLDVELIYAGGGNAVLLFRTEMLAHTFTKALTHTILRKAPGLQVVVAHQDFNRGEILANQLDLLRQAANRKKNKRYHSMPLLGLGVTADCQFIDLPAEAEIRDGDKNPLRVSGEVQAKYEHFNHACQRLVQEVRAGAPGDRALPSDMEFIYDFDQIGSPGESSFLAVVHIDGNGMGERFKALADAHQSADQNRAYIVAIRRLSERIRTIAKAALCETVLTLQCSIEPDEKGRDSISGEIVLQKQNGQLRLPFRPIVYGGDDVTFVCDGRLGLTLAAAYLQAMEQALDPEQADDPENRLFVRAGIAVVNNHYPFARAYALAEELAKAAKGYIQTISPTKRVSALDWHFAVNGLTLELDDLRQRDYHTKDGSLLLRPLLLKDYGDPTRWHTWLFFRRLMENFQHNADWAKSRNKLLAYGEALRNGPNAARQFLKAFKGDAHPGAPFDDKRKDRNAQEIAIDDEIRTCGWRNEEEVQYAVHYDAVEAIDFFVRLHTDKTDEQTMSQTTAMQTEGA